MKCWKRREIVCLICRVLAALVDDQRAPHCGEQLEESLQEEVTEENMEDRDENNAKLVTRGGIYTERAEFC